MGTPLRGELTQPGSNIPQAAAHPDIEDALATIQGVLSQVVRLSSARAVPAIVVSPTTTPTLAPAESAAPWSWTAAEAAGTEAALLPLLVHLAAARDDAEALAFCLAADGAAAAAKIGRAHV